MDFSEQFLVDCAYGYYSMSIQGFKGTRTIIDYMKYLTEYQDGFSVLQENYPDDWTYPHGTCKNDTKRYSGGQVTKFLYFPDSDENMLQYLLFRYGPVVTGKNIAEKKR